MSGDKIGGDLVLCHMLNEAVYPSRLCRGRPSNTQARIYSFECFGRDVVKLIVGLLFRISCPKIEIRLIPDFEIPLGDFVDAVAVH